MNPTSTRLPSKPFLLYCAPVLTAIAVFAGTFLATPAAFAERDLTGMPKSMAIVDALEADRVVARAKLQRMIFQIGDLDSVVADSLVCGPYLWAKIKGLPRIKTLKPDLLPLLQPTRVGSALSLVDSEAAMFSGADLTIVLTQLTDSFDLRGGKIRDCSMPEAWTRWVMQSTDLQEPFFMVERDAIKMMFCMDSSTREINWMDLMTDADFTRDEITALTRQMAPSQNSVVLRSPNRPVQSVAVAPPESMVPLKTTRSTTAVPRLTAEPPAAVAGAGGGLLPTLRPVGSGASGNLPRAPSRPPRAEQPSRTTQPVPPVMEVQRPRNPAPRSSGSSAGPSFSSDQSLSSARPSLRNPNLPMAKVIPVSPLPAVEAQPASTTAPTLRDTTAKLPTYPAANAPKPLLNPGPLEVIEPEIPTEIIEIPYRGATQVRLRGVKFQSPQESVDLNLSMKAFSSFSARLKTIMDASFSNPGKLFDIATRFTFYPDQAHEVDISLRGVKDAKVASTAYSKLNEMRTLRTKDVPITVVMHWEVQPRK